MDLFVLFSLFLDIFSYDFLIACRSNGVNIISLCPKLSSPQKLFNFGMSFEYFFGCDAFRDLSNLAWRHHGNRLNHEMDMVFIGSNLKKTHIVGWGKSNASFFQDCFHWFRKYLPAIFGWTNKVIKQTINIVLFVNVF